MTGVTQVPNTSMIVHRSQGLALQDGFAAIFRITSYQSLLRPITAHAYASAVTKSWSPLSISNPCTDHDAVNILARRSVPCRLKAMMRENARLSMGYQQ